MPEILSDPGMFKGVKILYVGIGNVLKKDDGIGVYISQRIKTRNNVSSITAEVSIENYIGKINSLRPDVLIIIDCVEMGESPGSYKLLFVSMLQDNTYNTHNISLKKLSEFFPMPVFILGIQPESVDFGENISYLVKYEADNLIKLINSEEELWRSIIYAKLAEGT